ncbi:MAG: hypothetical protein IPJ65_29770 [Archangiaceae bacterium]|nr:hypothetical protein [Archangiaceae bacterium]
MRTQEVPARPGSHRLRSREGYVDVWKAGPQVAYLGFFGTAELMVTDPLFKELEAYLRQDRSLVLFTDLSSVTDYETAFRERFTSWFRDHKSSISAVHALVGSGLVYMGIGVANIVLGGLIRPYRQRDAFEKVLTEASVMTAPSH